MRRLAIGSSTLGAGGLVLGVQLPVLAETVGKPLAQTAVGHSGIGSALGFLADPNLAFGLLLLALFGIGMELLHPGAIVPGVVGLLAGVLAIAGLLQLPVNWLGLLLVAAAAALFIVDTASPTHGLLSVAGAGAAIAGGWLLFRGPGVDLFVLLALPIGMAAAWVLVRARVLGVRHRPFPLETQDLLGRAAIVLERTSPIGIAQVDGELWRVVDHDDSVLEPGTEVEVVAQMGLTLVVRLRAVPTALEINSASPGPMVGAGAQPGGSMQ
jgi:membrane-bound serine protease (ClpP class)